METKRVTLYLNLEDDRDLEIWNFIKEQKKKPAFIKNILFSLSKNLELDKKVVPATKEDHREVKEIELDESELNDIDGF